MSALLMACAASSAQERPKLALPHVVQRGYTAKQERRSPRHTTRLDENPDTPTDQQVGQKLPMTKVRLWRSLTSANRLLGIGRLCGERQQRANPGNGPECGGAHARDAFHRCVCWLRCAQCRGAIVRIKGSVVQCSPGRCSPQPDDDLPLGSA